MMNKKIRKKSINLGPEKTPVNKESFEISHFTIAYYFEGSQSNMRYPKFKACFASFC